MMMRAVVRPRVVIRRLLSSEVSKLPRMSTSLVDEAFVDRFSADGAAVIRGFAPEVWVEAMREAAEANLACPGPLCDEHAAAQGSGGRFHDDQFLFHRHGVFDEFVRFSGAGDVAAEAMRSSSAHIFYDQLFVKEPGTDAPTPWHNDTSYWHLRGDQIISIWLALDAVPRHHGLSYVKGSHTWKLQHRVTNFSGDAHSDRNVYGDASEDLPPVPDVESYGADELLGWDMAAGDALLFYSAILHGAPGVGAESPHRRRGYATRWLGDDVVFEDKPGTMHTGWKAAGFDNGLEPGARIECELHPNVVGHAARPPARSEHT